MMNPRRAFTILEMMLALALASLAIGTVIGLYALLGEANRNASRRFEEAAQSTLAYEIIHDTMGDLVAATPMRPEALPGGGGGRELPSDPDADDLRRALTGGGDRVQSGQQRFSARPASDTPVMFELLWEELGAGVTVQRLEVVTLRAHAGIELLPDELLEQRPSPEQRVRWETPGRVRSSFELMYDEEDEHWDLMWRPVDPPGYAVPIIDDVVMAQWSVLMRSQVESASAARSGESWGDVAAAFLGEDFPVAVRLEFETGDGRAGDWLFETLVVTREY